MDSVLHTDPQEQLRSLYKSLLNRQQNLDEFKQLLSQYPPIRDDDGEEPLVAAEVRERLNQRIREWTGQNFGGLSATQMHMWRAIVLDRRLALPSPWSEPHN
jgi:hypothetical protein